MAVIEVDQSGKWEEGKNTAIGVNVAGAGAYGVLVTNESKNLVMRHLGKFKQEKNRSKKMKNIRMFAYTVFLAVKDLTRKEDTLVIDSEYQGNEESIREILLFLFKKFTGASMSARQIQFDCIGKHSKAHAVAKQTFTGVRKADKQLAIGDYFRLLDRTREIREKALQQRKQKKARRVQRDFHPPDGITGDDSQLPFGSSALSCGKFSTQYLLAPRPLINLWLAAGTGALP